MLGLLAAIVGGVYGLAIGTSAEAIFAALVITGIFALVTAIYVSDQYGHSSTQYVSIGAGT